MSVVFIITPVLVNLAWPLVAAAAASAAASMGMAVVETGVQTGTGIKDANSSGLVSLVLKNTESLAETMGQEEAITLEKDGVRVTLKRTPEGKCGVEVRGKGKTDDELEAIGRELAQRVIQACVRQKVEAEAKARGFKLAEDTQKDGTVRLRFTKWG